MRESDGSPRLSPKRSSLTSDISALLKEVSEALHEEPGFRSGRAVRTPRSQDGPVSMADIGRTPSAENLGSRRDSYGTASLTQHHLDYVDQVDHHSDHHVNHHVDHHMDQMDKGGRVGLPPPPPSRPSAGSSVRLGSEPSMVSSSRGSHYEDELA